MASLAEAKVSKYKIAMILKVPRRLVIYHLKPSKGMLEAHNALS